MKHLVLCLSLLAILGAGCPLSRDTQAPATLPPPLTPPQNEEGKARGGGSEPQTGTTEKPVEAMKPSASTYQTFTKAGYDAARASGKPIFLFFYANWCPTCREQEPRLQQVVPSHMGGVAGFRVNFNDTETDSEEKTLAKEFGVTYQHTGFFIGRDGAVAQKTIGTISDAKTTEYLDQISK